MTEIPEHLLKRSHERRAALGLPTGGDEAAAGSPPASPPGEGDAVASPPAPAAAVTPARRPSAPEPAAPPPPKPDPPYVRAAKRRRKIPIWALPVLALLPLWALLYALAMRPPEVKLTGPLAEGSELFAGKCASCHGTTGGGGTGYQLSAGEVLKTFPGIEAQLEFVTKGSQVFAGQVYGDPNRPGGPHVGLARNGTAMPAFGAELTAAEIMAVVCHERYTLSGADQTGEEFLQYCAPDAPKFAEAEAAG